VAVVRESGSYPDGVRGDRANGDGHTNHSSLNWTSGEQRLLHLVVDARVRSCSPITEVSASASSPFAAFTHPAITEPAGNAGANWLCCD
jgi:hypothetical protein